MAGAVDVSGIPAFAHKFQKEILSQVYMKLENQGITVMENVDVAYRFPKFSVSPSLAPYSSTYTGAGAAVLSDRELVVRDAKAEYSLDPYDFEATYLRQHRRDANLATMPYENFFWQKIVEKIADEIVRYVIWYGDTTDTNTIKAYRITDGFKKIIAAAVTASTITPIVTGTPTSSNAVAKAELMYTTAMSQYPGLESADNLVLYMSHAQRRNYNINYRASLPYDPNNYSDGVKKTYLTISDGKCEIRGVDWLNGSNKYILTPESNLVFGTNKLSDLSTIKVVPKVWGMDTGIRFVMGLQIADLEVLFVNDAT